MAKKKFTPKTGDLSLLSAEESAAYVQEVCDFLEVPYNLGLITLGPMDSGDGARKTVLYVQRGATDIIRGRFGIDIDSMEKDNGEGYVGWVVRGHDKTGRHEMAVGTVSIEGLRGKQRSDAVMFAQTKALRRLTLNFAGGGFLDESEVSDRGITTNLSNPSASLKEIAQPTVVPNATAGKDITPPQSEPLPVAVGDGPNPAAQAAEPKKRTPRKKKGTVSLDTPSVSEKSQTELEPLPEPKPEPPKTESAIRPAAPIETAPAAVPSPEPPKEEYKLPEGQTRPTDEQKSDFKKRFSIYVNDTLRNAKPGLVQSDTMGRHDKLTMFVQKMFPAANTKRLSLEQWTHFFEYCEGKIKDVGAGGLVKIIEEKIGEKSE